MSNVGRIDIGPPRVDEYDTGWDYRAITDIWLGYELAFTPNERVPNDLIVRRVVDPHLCHYHLRSFLAGYADEYTDVYAGYPFGPYNDTYADGYEV